MEKMKKTADVMSKILLGVCILLLVVFACNVALLVLLRVKPGSKLLELAPLALPSLDAYVFGKLSSPGTVSVLTNIVNSLWGAVVAFIAFGKVKPLKESVPLDGTISRGLYIFSWFVVTGKFATALLKEILLVILAPGYEIKIGNVITSNVQIEGLVFVAMLLMSSFIIRYVEESEFMENRRDVRQKMRLEAVNSVSDPIFVTGFEVSTVGNMEGSRHVCLIEQNNKGDTRLTTTDAADWNSDPVKKVDDVDAAILAELDVIFRKYKMSFWTSLPTGTHVNDAATTTYRFKFASNNSEFVFSTKQDLPDEAQTAMKEIKELLNKYIK